MEYRVERLTVKDFDEFVGFLHDVFTKTNNRETDFIKMFPRLLLPTKESMNNQLAIRENGKIVSAGSILEANYLIGSKKLKVAATGNISTDECVRGKGLMNMLVTRLSEIVAEEGFDFVYLNGKRERYQRFGYEKCGSAHTFKLPLSEMESEYTFLSFNQLSEAEKEIGLALYESDLHFEVSLDNFEALLSGHSSKAYFAKNKKGELSALLITSAPANITDIYVKTKDMVAVLNSYMLFASVTELTVKIPPFSTEKITELKGCATEHTVFKPSHFRILNFKNVMEAVLECYAKSGKEDFFFTLNSSIFGCYTIGIAKGKPLVEKTDEECEYQIEGLSVYEFLFSHDYERKGREKEFLPIPLYCPQIR